MSRATVWDVAASLALRLSRYGSHPRVRVTRHALRLFAPQQLREFDGEIFMSTTNGGINIDDEDDKKKHEDIKVDFAPLLPVSHALFDAAALCTDFRPPPDPAAMPSALTLSSHFGSLATPLPTPLSAVAEDIKEMAAAMTRISAPAMHHLRVAAERAQHFDFIDQDFAVFRIPAFSSTSRARHPLVSLSQYQSVEIAPLARVHENSPTPSSFEPQANGGVPPCTTGAGARRT